MKGRKLEAWEALKLLQEKGMIVTALGTVIKMSSVWDNRLHLTDLFDLDFYENKGEKEMNVNYIERGRVLQLLLSGKIIGRLTLYGERYLFKIQDGEVFQKRVHYETYDIIKDWQIQSIPISYFNKDEFYEHTEPEKPKSLSERFADQIEKRVDSWNIVICDYEDVYNWLKQQEGEK